MGTEQKTTNSYTGVIEDWKLNILVDRAQRLGFRGQDVEDALQEGVIALQSFKYDPQNPEGASESTALTTWIDHTLIKLQRTNTRWHSRQDLAARLQSGIVPGKNVYLSADVRAAIQTLPEFERNVCELICSGVERRDLRTVLNCRMDEVFNAILTIRQHFIELGVNEWLYEK